MRITQECDYAIRIMVALAALPEGRVLDAGAVSESKNIPSRFTVKILRKLVLAGFISSKKGVGGGYFICKLPEKITLLDVVEIIDGPIEVSKCISDDSKCSMDKAACSVHHIMMEINKSIREKLESITVKDLM